VQFFFSRVLFSLPHVPSRPLMIYFQFLLKSAEKKSINFSSPLIPFRLFQLRRDHFIRLPTIVCDTNIFCACAQMCDDPLAPLAKATGLFILFTE